MSISHIVAIPQTKVHDTWREGVRLGLILATALWIWVALVDVVAGQPFHTFSLLGGIVVFDAVAGQPFQTFAALGGITVFTVVHYLLNIAYGVALVSAIHGAARAPSLIIAVVFGLVTFEGAIAMFTNLLAQYSVGRIAWAGLFGGSVVGLIIAALLLSRTHPLGLYLRRAEVER